MFAASRNVALRSVLLNAGTPGQSVILEDHQGASIVTLEAGDAKTESFSLDIRLANGLRARGSGAGVEALVSFANINDIIDPFLFGGGTPPTLTSIDVASGSAMGGTAVELTGQDFADPLAGPTSVLFGGVPATMVVITSDTTITCLSPAGTPSAAVDVTVSSANGEDTLAAAFTYFAMPTVTGITPATGSQMGGTAVTIDGTGFQNNSPGTNVVTIGGVPCTSVVVNTDIELTCVTPAGAGVDDVVVTNNNGAGTLSSGWTYFPAPTVTGVAPSSGSEGTEIVITGTGFVNNSPGTNVPAVNGVPCTSVVVDSDTQITCDVPAGSGIDQTVSVTNDNGVGSLSSAFSYPPAPTVTSIMPARGPQAGGTAVSIEGTGFVNFSPGTNTVQIGGVNCTSVVVVSDTEITAVSPAGSGIDNVTVQNNNGTGTLTLGWTYNNAPTVTSITPNTGDPAGGEAVTIGGTGFQNFAPGTNTVTIGGNPCTSVVTVNNTTITCVTPAGSGVDDVVVSNNNGVGTLSSGFTYDSSPDSGATTAYIIQRQARAWHGAGVFRRTNQRG